MSLFSVSYTVKSKVGQKKFSEAEKTNKFTTDSDRSLFSGFSTCNSTFNLNKGREKRFFLFCRCSTSMYVCTMYLHTILELVLFKSDYMHRKLGTF